MTAWLCLAPDQTEEADAVARARRLAAIERGRVGRNNAPMENVAATKLDIVGARAEIVGKFYLDPVEWHALADEVDNLPDLDDFIDVKGRQGRNDDVIIQAGSEDQWAYLAVYIDKHPWCELHGWAWGYELKQQQWWRDPTGCRPAFFVPKTAKIFRPMSELYNELRKRQGEPL